MFNWIKKIFIEDVNQRLFIENVRLGNLQLVNAWWKNGIDINGVDKYGYTALMWAAYQGHLAIVKILLENDKIDSNIANEYFANTALTLATQEGHLAIVKILLENDKVNTNASNRYGTALIIAAQRGRLEIVKVLLKNDKVNINASDINGNTALMWATKNNDVQIVELLLAKESIDINYANKNGDTALTFAANNGFLKIVKTLLAVNAEFDIKKIKLTKALFMELSPKLLLKIGGMHSKYYNNEITKKEWWKKWKINAIENKQANQKTDQQQSQEIINFTNKNDMATGNELTVDVYQKRYQTSEKKVNNLNVIVGKEKWVQQNQKIINFAETNNYDEQLMLLKIASSPNPPTNNLINEKQKKCKKQPVVAI